MKLPIDILREAQQRGQLRVHHAETPAVAKAKRVAARIRKSDHLKAKLGVQDDPSSDADIAVAVSYASTVIAERDSGGAATKGMFATTWATWCRRADELRERHPEWSHWMITRTVAGEFKVGHSTVRKRVPKWD